ncbi:hypothetical protein MAFF301560_45420 (plasmid) [Ralstonia solanacearum]|nr:hypothetical protein MAFF301560_45420 [Ralstonia solanacearum]BEU49218.1 hypothetical protein MAFF211519_45430 [Ralstonia pseudosolanacearum]
MYAIDALGGACVDNARHVRHRHLKPPVTRLSKYRIPIDIEDIDLAVFKSAFQRIKTMVLQIGMLSI